MERRSGQLDLRVCSPHENAGVEYKFRNHQHMDNIQSHDNGQGDLQRDYGYTRM